MSMPPPPPLSPPTPGPSGPFGGLTPGEAPPKASKLRFVLIGVVVVALVAVGVFLATRSDDSGGGGGLTAKAKAARTALQAAIDDADFNTDGESNLSRCPLGRMSKLDDLVSAEVDLGSLADDDGSFQIKDATDVEPQQIICSQVNAEFISESAPIAIAYEALLDPPRDIEGYLEDVASADDETFTAGDPVSFQAGTIHRGCQDNSFSPVCSAVWVDGKGGIAIAVLLVGDTTDEVDASAALRQVLTTVLDNLASS